MKLSRKRRLPKSEKAVDNLFASSLYFSASALARAAEDLAAECFRPTGLSPSLANVVYLMTTSNTSVFTPSYLAKSLLLSPSTMTRLLDQLEKKRVDRAIRI